MTLIADIRTLLLADSAVNTRVGGERIYNNRLPQRKSTATAIDPAIVLSVLDDVPVGALDRQYSIRPSVQVNHFGPDHRVSEEMEAETRAVLESYQGLLGGISVRIIRTDARDDIEPDLDIAMKVSEYQVWL